MIKTPGMAWTRGQILFQTQKNKQNTLLYVCCCFYCLTHSAAAATVSMCENYLAVLLPTKMIVNEMHGEETCPVLYFIQSVVPGGSNTIGILPPASSTQKFING